MKFMKKRVIALSFVFAFILLVLGLDLVSAGAYTYLRAYYDSLNQKCKTDSDCVIKNVQNCCGYYPLCINKNTTLIDEEVQDICLNERNLSCQASVNVAYCRCQKSGGSYRCKGYTGRPVLNCGDGNCFFDETNVSSPDYCLQDCVYSGPVINPVEIDYYSCNKNEDCMKVDDGCCGCNSGGKATAINKKYKQEWEQNLSTCDVGCITVISDDPSCFNTAKCINNKCSLVEEIICPMLVPPNCPKGGEIISQGKDDKGCDKPGKCIKKLSNGRNAEIKIMPETASERARERLGELGFNVTLKEIGNDKIAYEMTAEKQGKMFGLFKVKGKISAEVDAESGNIIKVKKPWWSFLASGI